MVIPARNYGRYLGACLDALLTQSALPDEILVVDDASSDSTAAVIAAAQRRDGRVRGLRLDAQAGLFGALQHGIAHAAGDCLYLHAADDYALPGFVERSLALLAAHPEAGLCCSDPVYLDEETGRTRIQALGWAASPRYLSPAALAGVIGGRAIAGHTVIVRRDAWQDAGGQDPELRWHADWFAWLAIAFRRGICYVPDGLAVARVHGASYSTTGRREPAAVHAVLRRLMARLHADEARDLVPFFVRGDVLAHHGVDLVRWLIADGTRDATTLALARAPIRTWALREGRPDLARDAALASAAFELQAGRWRTALREVAREAARQPGDAALAAQVTGIAAKLKQSAPPADCHEDPPGYDHVRRVAIFGAGEHGERAWELARRCGWDVACFLDNAANGGHQTLAGRPVVTPAAVDRREIDLLIVASDAWRDEMFAQAAALGFRPGEDVVWFRQPLVVGGIRFAVEQ